MSRAAQAVWFMAGALSSWVAYSMVLGSEVNDLRDQVSHLYLEAQPIFSLYKYPDGTELRVGEASIEGGALEVWRSPGRPTISIWRGGAP